MFQNTAHSLVDGLVNLLSDGLHPLMFIGFGVAVVLKGLVVYTIRRQWWFAKEFEKRVVRFTDRKDHTQNPSYFAVCKRLLERTYYELFEVRGIMMRRKLDFVSSPIDRLFAIQQGCAWVVKDTLKEIRHLKYGKDQPRFLEISKVVNQGNPCFGKLFGWLPLGPINDVLNLLPGLFIIGGIFGTFLGIMQGLPELGQLDLKDAAASKVIMDTFLAKVSFAIVNSIIGIFLSVVLTVIYSVLSIEKQYIRMVDIYDRCLSRVWECCDHNNVPANIEGFNEHKDPVDALAALAIQKATVNSVHNQRYAYPPSETAPDMDEESTKKAS